jgi:hypothetical protein
VIQTLAAHDAVETADVVAVAKEVATWRISPE